MVSHQRRGRATARPHTDPERIDIAMSNPAPAIDADTQTARAADTLRFQAGDLTPTERFVFLTIAAQHDTRGPNSTHPHFIALMTGIARGKVDKIVAALLDMGYLTTPDGLVSVYEVAS
jgi:hypothetical protein